MKILPLLVLLLAPAALAKKDTIPFSTKIIKQDGKDVRVLQPMLPVYFEVTGNDSGLGTQEVMMCRIVKIELENVGGTGKTFQEDSEVECKNGTYKFQVRRIFFEDNNTR